MTHLTDPMPEVIGVLGVLPLVEGEGALDLPLRRRRQVRPRDLHQLLLDPLVPHESPDAFLDRKADTRGLGGIEPRE
jgi:hypothetical protein